MRELKENMEKVNIETQNNTECELNMKSINVRFIDNPINSDADNNKDIITSTNVVNQQVLFTKDITEPFKFYVKSITKCPKIIYETF